MQLSICTIATLVNTVAEMTTLSTLSFSVVCSLYNMTPCVSIYRNDRCIITLLYNKPMRV